MMSFWEGGDLKIKGFLTKNGIAVESPYSYFLIFFNWLNLEPDKVYNKLIIISYVFELNNSGVSSTKLTRFFQIINSN
jgi:hypothetical protein